MNFDPNNPVIALCIKGMQFEGEGKIDEAHGAFQQAWDMAANNFDRFTAAHYLARTQKDPGGNLRWNLDALRFAMLLADDEIKTQYPSLYLNIGKSYEQLNQPDKARDNYRLAAEYSEHLAEGGLGNVIRLGIQAGLSRTNGFTFNYNTLDRLIGNWCERQDLRPLSLILPAYLQNLGTAHDRNKLITALSYLSAAKFLPADEQVEVEGLIKELAAE